MAGSAEERVDNRAGGGAGMTGENPSARSPGASARAISAAIVLLGLAATGTLMALGYGVEARRLPLVVGFPLTVMALANLLVVIRAELLAHGRIAAADSGTRGSDQGPDAAGAATAGEAGLEEATDEGLSFRTSAFSVVVIAVLFFFLGLIPTAVIYTVGFMRGIGRERWVKCLTSSALLVVMFWAFRTFLNVRFYRGWLATEGIIPYFLPF